MMKTDKIGLYVHVPFCVRKCNYCDFCSFPNLDLGEREEYVSALIEEIKGYKRSKRISLDTIFFGGGTPSLLTVHQLTRICRAIEESFDVAPNTEFTVEVNPKTVSAEKIEAFLSVGVNRISIGLQSIHENELKKLGRIHTYEDFLETYELIRGAGIKNVNIDLMYALPNQTRESLAATLDAICTLAPEHISAYSLIVEEGTPFYLERASLTLPDDDAEYEMYLTLTDVLKKHGYIHYEISNYAKEGYAAAHNLKYWHNKEYIGVGVSAYSNFEGSRFGNPRELAAYLSGVRAADCEATDAASYAYEYAMLGLRLSEGISLSRYKELSGIDLLLARGEQIKKYLSLGLVSVSGDRLMLTESGFYVSNAILAELL